jgi:hypothetical protein
MTNFLPNPLDEAKRRVRDIESKFRVNEKRIYDTATLNYLPSTSLMVLRYLIHEELPSIEQQLKTLENLQKHNLNSLRLTLFESVKGLERLACCQHPQVRPAAHAAISWLEQIQKILDEDLYYCWSHRKWLRA